MTWYRISISIAVFEEVNARNMPYSTQFSSQMTGSLMSSSATSWRRTPTEFSLHRFDAGKAAANAAGQMSSAVSDGCLMRGPKNGLAQTPRNIPYISGPYSKGGCRAVPEILCCWH